MNRLGWAVAIALLVAYFGVIGPMDYADDLMREAETKVLRARLAAAEQPQAAPSPPEARIWSKRCAKQGKQFVAWQADGDRWHLQCVTADFNAKGER